MGAGAICRPQDGLGAGWGCLAAFLWNTEEAQQWELTTPGRIFSASDPLEAETLQAEHKVQLSWSKAFESSLEKKGLGMLVGLELAP